MEVDNWTLLRTSVGLYSTSGKACVPIVGGVIRFDRFVKVGNITMLSSRRRGVTLMLMSSAGVFDTNRRNSVCWVEERYEARK